MVECNFIKAPNIYPNLNDQQQFRLNKINEIKIILFQRLMSKRLSKYTASFDYFDKSLITFLQQVVAFLLHYLLLLLVHLKK